jgi:hypothetical protein
MVKNHKKVLKIIYEFISIAGSTTIRIEGLIPSDEEKLEESKKLMGQLVGE